MNQTVKYLLRFSDRGDIIFNMPTGAVETEVICVGNEANAGPKKKPVDERTMEKIIRSVTARMNSVLLGLAEHGELSQGDLARAIGLNATALSNLLVKFERMDVKLLLMQSVGRYRYYRLSEEGRAYLEATGQTVPETGGEPESADAALYDEAKRALEELKQVQKEKWKGCFNKTVVALIQGRGSARPQEGEDLVYRYLRCVERLVMRGSHTALDEVLDELSDDTLRDDVEEFMEYFQNFTYILSALEQCGDPTDVYLLVKAAFFNEVSRETELHIAKIGWDNDGYTKLRERAQTLKTCVNGYSEEEISRYFHILLPDQKPLSLYIARCICGAKGNGGPCG